MFAEMAALQVSMSVDRDYAGGQCRTCQLQRLPGLYQHSQYAILLQKPLSLFLKEGPVALLHCHQLLLKIQGLSCMQCTCGR